MRLIQPASLGLLMLLCLMPAQNWSEEPFSAFVQGLRERQYYDYVLFYLDQMALKPDVPQGWKEILPYERAITLLEQAKTSRSPEKQAELLDQALNYLEEFARTVPNHPRAAEANMQRAEILIGKARVEIVQSRSPVNQGNRAAFQQRARDYIHQAKTVFQTALQQHEAALKQYGTFIDRQQHPERWAAREKAQYDAILAQINLAQCLFEEAQTYDEDNETRRQLLQRAAEEFEKLYQQHRSVVGGLYAQLYQGKCYEELGDLQKAMGIYNQLLSHPGQDDAMVKLQNLTLSYKLSALNSKQRSDHQLVIDLGEEWLKTHRNESRSLVGLAIRWEVARAYEALGDRRDIPKEEAQRAWRAAREQAEQIQRFPSEHRDAALAMIQRLETKLGGKDRLPASFDAAFGFAKQLITTIKETKDALEAARQQQKPAAEIQKLQQDLEGQLKQAAELFDLALRLAGKNDDPKSITTARYMYAYVNYLLRRNYEAAILAEYVARTADKEDTTTALDAAYLSLAAYVQAFNDTSGNPSDKQADIDFIVKACRLITNRWPSSSRANDARMTLGRIYTQLKQPREAARWYEEVPESDPAYPSAQISAGQAYWEAYLRKIKEVDAASTSANLSNVPPTSEDRHLWRDRAEQLLKNGVQRMISTVPREGEPPAEMIAGKMSLAQIALYQGKDAEAVRWLLDEPHPVVKAVMVPEGAVRPDKGIKSRQFAMETYKLLLRAYIGMNKLDEARETMRTLEGMAGQESGDEITDLYVGLGKLLREELEQYYQAGERERFQTLLLSFENFLKDLGGRQEGQSLGSLSWIGETYLALGDVISEQSAGDYGRSSRYYAEAEKAFRQILSRANNEPQFVKSEQVPGVKLRLAYVLRQQRRYDEAEEILVELLRNRPNDLRAQMAAAELYHLWGQSGAPEDAPRLLKAIGGDSSKNIWGWGQLGVRLQRAIEQGQHEYLDNFLQARRQGTLARLEYARQLKDQKKRQMELDKCEVELVATVSVIRGITADQLASLNEVYHQVLTENGKPVRDLQPAQDAPQVIAETPHDRQVPKKSAAVAKPKRLERKSSSWLMLLGAGGALIGIGAMLFLVLRRKPVPASARLTTPPPKVPSADQRATPRSKTAGTPKPQAGGAVPRSTTTPQTQKPTAKQPPSPPSAGSTPS
ncbi:MAG: hypothetical protein KatS3mg113_0278 [Planctomycetaceae bacterium]|nr:MAG: hypothetical protein KatS3mg113_0278 [Planctomycetaceae bacterium]